MGEAAARQRRLPADPRITITAQMKSISLAIAIALLPGLAAAQSTAAGTVMEDGAIVINMKAVEELAGARTAAEIAARLNPTRDVLEDPTLFTPMDPAIEDEAPTRGERLQILYARGSLVISPSAQETLIDWTESFLAPGTKVEILSYSGTVTPALRASGNNPGNDLMTYSLHEAIRTAFKRAIVVRDILVEQGVNPDDITLRALGPASDGGAPERVDVVALSS